MSAGDSTFLWQVPDYLGSVNKVAKAILVGAISLVALGAVAVLLLNVYVQSAGVQQRLETELSRALGVPVRVQGTSFSPFGGLRLKGVTVPDVDHGADRNFLESSGVTVSFRILPVFVRRFVIDEIALNDPKVVWEQSSKGKWSLPGQTAEARKEDVESPQPLPEELPVGVAPAEVAQAGGSTVDNTAKRPLFDVEVNQFRVNRGSFAFLGEEGQPVASFKDIDVSARLRNEGFAGVATSAETVVAGKFVFSLLRAPFAFESETLTIDRLTADLAGGKVRGDLELSPEEGGTPFTTKIEFEEVDLARLLVESGNANVRAQGRLKGFLELSGQARSREDLEGRGAIVLTNGEMEQYEVLQQIGRILAIDDLQHLKLSAAEARYTIRKGNIDVERLNLQSQNLRVDAEGRIKRDGKLDMRARLTLESAVARQLPPFIEGNLQKVPDSDARYLDFKIKGTLESPDTNLVELVLGRQLKQEVSNFIQNLWGGGKDKPDEKGEKPR